LRLKASCVCCSSSLCLIDSFVLYKMEITVTDVNATLLIAAVLCIIVIALQFSIWSTKATPLMVASIASVILLQYYNGFVNGVSMLQIESSDTQFYIFIIATFVIYLILSCVESWGVWVVAAVLLFVFVVGSYSKGTDWLNANLDVDMTTGAWTGIWLGVLFGLAGLCWACQKITWVSHVVTILLNSVVIVSIIAVCAMYQAGQQQTGYVLFDFTSITLLVEFIVIIVVYGIAYIYCIWVKRHTEQLKEECKYSRIALTKGQEHAKQQQKKDKEKQTPTPLPPPPPLPPPIPLPEHHHHHHIPSHHRPLIISDDDVLPTTTQ
jgi:hypothetical protein